jgi:hypothetical protein
VHINLITIVGALPHFIHKIAEMTKNKNVLCSVAVSWLFLGILEIGSIFAAPSWFDL